MDPLAKRYFHDFEEALPRVATAHKGMIEYFKYTGDAPPPAGTPEYKLFDECLIWVRKAISYLIALKQHDQQASTTLSLKTIAHDRGKDWNSILTHGMFDFELLPQDLCQGYSLVRLRSVALSVIETQTPDTVDLWTIEVSTGASKLTAPRVRSRSDLRDADQLGSSVLNNLSPFGKWHLAIAAKSIKGRLAQNVIDDIWMDFNCVMNRA
jgi:hypothetical protein